MSERLLVSTVSVYSKKIIERMRYLRFRNSFEQLSAGQVAGACRPDDYRGLLGRQELLRDGVPWDITGFKLELWRCVGHTTTTSQASLQKNRAGDIEVARNQASDLVNGDELVPTTLNYSMSGFDLRLVLWADVVQQEVIVEIGHYATLQIDLLGVGIEVVLLELCRSAKQLADVTFKRAWIG